MHSLLDRVDYHPPCRIAELFRGMPGLGESSRGGDSFSKRNMLINGHAVIGFHTNDTTRAGMRAFICGSPMQWPSVKTLPPEGAAGDREAVV